MTLTLGLVYLFTTSLLLVVNILPPELCKWYVVLYGFIFLVLAIVVRPTIMVKHCWALAALIFANVLALLAHAGDVDSILNLGSRILSIVGLAALARAAVLVVRPLPLLNRLRKALWFAAGAMLILSTILTAAHSSAAPSYFFWVAFFSEKRLLVLASESYGHCDLLWVAMFLFLLEMSHNLGRKLGSLDFAVFAALSLVLIGSKARVGILFFIVVALTIAAYSKRGIGSRALLACMPFVLCAVFFAGIFSNGAQATVTGAVSSLQDKFPLLRIKGSSGEDGISVYTGRDVLNLLLLRASAEHPFIGHGHASPYLTMQIGKHGEFTTGAKIAARDESWLRMPVAYGWPYSLCVMGFLLVPMVRAVRGYYRDNVFVIAVVSTILLCVITEGGMEQFYGISALYLFLILILYFTPRVALQEQLA